MSPILAGLASSFGVRRGGRKALRGIPHFIRDLRAYQHQQSRQPDAIFPIRFREMRPYFPDRFGEAADLDLHYFYQDIWIAQRILACGPSRHVDVGSRIDGFVAHLLCYRELEVVDIRPLSVSHPNLRFREGNLLSLPYADASVESLSCLHTLEHVGLGRYGDTVDIQGHEKAMAELERAIGPHGRLYVSVPIGRERVEFNAHRVLDPSTVLRGFRGLELASFAVVTDGGQFLEGVDPLSFRGSRYGCGMFEFTKAGT